MINQDHGRKNEQPKQQQSQQRWKARDNIEAATRQGYGRTHRQVGRVSSRDLCVCVRERMNVFVSKPARTRRAREERQSHPGNAWETSKNKQTKNRLSQGIHGVKNRERTNRSRRYRKIAVTMHQAIMKRAGMSHQPCLFVAFPVCPSSCLSAPTGALSSGLSHCKRVTRLACTIHSKQWTG